MRLLAALLVLPLAAPAQEPPLAGPGSVNPRTGGIRPAFDPTSAEDARADVDACLAERLLAPEDAQAAVLTCHAEALEACRAVTAAFPLARDECDLELRLAWGDVRYETGNAVSDRLGASDEPGAAEQLDAFWASDDAWRIENGDACVTPDPAKHDACTLDRERDRAALYLGTLAGLGG